MTAIDLLALAAHPDDAEFGCGGALLLAGDAGLRVAVADLSRGEMATRGTPDQRRDERARATAILGLARRVSLDLPDTALGTDPAHRVAVVELLRRLQPRVVLAPATDDRHPDHAATGRLAREACFLAGVARFATGRAHHPARLYHYALHHQAEPTVILDVSAVWDRKVAAVMCYRSQLESGAGEPATPLTDPRFLRMLEARATLLGAMIGVERGEGFLTVGPVALDRLPGPLDRSVEGYRSEL